MVERSVRLLAITDRRIMGSDPLSRVRELARKLRERLILQIREKDLEPRTLYAWVEDLLPLFRENGCALFVNGRADVVRCFAPFVGLHLPEEDISVRDARRVLGDSTPIGASVHCAARACSCADQGANLIVISPVFETPSKAGLGEPLGLSGLRATLDAVGNRATVVALGGIDRTNAASVLETGAHGVGAIRASWLSEDPEALIPALLSKTPAPSQSFCANSARTGPT